MTDQAQPGAEVFSPDSNEFKLLNDCAKRVHTVMCVAAEKYALARPEKALSHNETMALLNGAMSGIAVMAAQMTVSATVAGKPVAIDDSIPPPEAYLLEMLGAQFLAVYAQQTGQPEVTMEVTAVEVPLSGATTH